MEGSSDQKDFDKLIQLHEKFAEYEEVKAIIESLPLIQNDTTQTEVKLDRFQCKFCHNCILFAVILLFWMPVNFMYFTVMCLNRYYKPVSGAATSVGPSPR